MNSYDLVVIGSGPGGEVGAIRAAQLGMKVALVEKNEHLGGTCLNVGCIPTKALLESAKVYDKLSKVGELGIDVGKVSFSWNRVMERKDAIVDQQRKGLRFLMKKNKIDVLGGHGRLAGKGQVTVMSSAGEKMTVQTKHCLLATGSRVRDLPIAKPDGKVIFTSDSILFIDRVPQSMIIVGGGVVGIEFASLFSRFGTKVTVVEALPQILTMEDEETVKELTKHLTKSEVTFLLSKKVATVKTKGKEVEVELENEKTPLHAETLLLSVGRVPVTEDLGLDTVQLTTEKGFIKVDDHYQTKSPGIYAIGDIINTPALAHTASAEAIHAVECMAGHHPPLINYQANPNAVYSYPEIASIGYTEKDLKAKNLPYEVAKFPFAPLAKAKIEQSTEGFIKILFEKKYKELLGVHIVGAKATELIAEFALGKNLETTLDEIGFTIHPHPTISETVMEAAHAGMGGAIHT